MMSFLKRHDYFRGRVVDHADTLVGKRLKEAEVKLKNGKARLTLTCEDGSYVSFSLEPR